MLPRSEEVADLEEGPQRAAMLPPLTPSLYDQPVSIWWMLTRSARKAIAQAFAK